MTPTEKKTTGVQQRAQTPGQPQEQMELAYQIHTLAQMLYGHISVSHPWVAQPWSPMQPGMTLQHLQPGIGAAQPMHPFQPGVQPMQPGVQPMAQNWVAPQQPMQTPFLQYPFGPFPR